MAETEPAGLQLAVGGTATQATTFHLVAPTTLLVGRAEDCDIRPAAHDRKVSRHHCRIEVDPPAVSVIDLGSTNGTQVNGVGIGEHLLSDGDEITAGGIRMRVRGLPEALPTCAGYQLIRELGRGGEGIAYLASAEPDGAEAVVKVLFSGTVRADMERGFLREMDNVSGIRHPNIVRYLGGGETEGTLFLATEYCRGGSLQDLAARRGGRLPVDEAVAVAGQVLDALDYLHRVEVANVRLAGGETGTATGLVHRDVKPQNVLLDRASGTPVVKLADFGLAKAFELAGRTGNTPTGTGGGTLGFMSRAQVVNYKYARPEADVWASAACLYWMISGATPRDFPPGIDPYIVVLRESVVPLRDRGVPVPSGLAALIDAALSDDSGAAFRTAAEFKRALLLAR
jgi:serine/threonine protein kinase